MVAFKQIRHSNFENGKISYTRKINDAKSTGSLSNKVCRSYDKIVKVSDDKITVAQQITVYFW